MNIAHTVLATLGALGLIAPFLVALADSALIPMGQSVDVLILAQALANPEKAVAAGALAVAGSTLGSMSLYWMSRKAGRKALEKRIRSERIDEFGARLKRYDALALLAPTMLPLPLPMKPLVAAAGVLRISAPRVAATIAVARTVRYIGVALLARHYGSGTQAFVEQNLWFAAAAMTTLGLIGAFIVLWRVQKAGVPSR